MCDTVEGIGTKYRVARAVELAAYLVATTTRMEGIRHADIEKDDLHRTIVEQAGGQGSRVTKSKLCTGTLKDLVRSLRTSISVTKLCDADKAVREYLLYVLLDACLRASERVNVPVDLRKQEYTAQQWAALGKELAGTQATKFRLPVEVTGQLAGAPAVV